MKKLFPYIVSFLLIFPVLSFGQEDIFQVKTPNVMIIFDTSSSMDKKPNQADAASGNMCVDTFGRIQAANGGAPPCGTGYTQYNFEGGANHPSSKLYQAKLALKEVIEDVVKDRVNLGFATYAQFKTEKRRGYYVRDRRNYTAPVSEYWYWYKKYWRFKSYNHSNSITIISYSPDKFTDEWGTIHTGVDPVHPETYTFTRTHTFDNSWANNNKVVPPMNPLGATPGTYTADLTYKVTSRVYNAEYNRYTYTYQTIVPHDHYEETWRYINRPNDNPISCNAHFTSTWNKPGDPPTYYTFETTDPDQMANTAKWKCYGPIYVPGVTGGFGSWYTEYSNPWLEFSGTSCPDEWGSDNLLVPNANRWTRWYRVGTGNCYDWSTYYYPALGLGNPPPKPHIWSYFKMSGGNWFETDQTPNYYPSKDGLNFNNNPGTINNRYFFVNFPDDKDAGFTPAIRTANRNQITSFLDLTPVQSPETLKYWTKLPVHAFGGRAGLTSNTTESFFTPLADSLKYAFKYFNDYIHNYNGGDPASQQLSGGVLCRGNYIILLTDGLESARLSGTLPDYAAAATEAATLSAPPVNVKTFVIGFGTDLQGNNTLQNIASSGGTQQAYFAVDLETLKGKLREIFQVILGATYGRSNPVITKAGDRIFRSYFEIMSDESWKGHLAAYNINTSTGEIITPFVWDAGQRLTSDGRGTVYTWTDGPTRQEFIPVNTDIYSLVNPSNEDINGDGFVNNLDAQTVINYTRDPRHGYYPVTNPNPPFDTKWVFPYKGARPVEGTYPDTPIGWKLGDIYHSTPVLVGAPPHEYTEKTYATFLQNYRNRTQMVYVGANDGMLHGIKNTKGTASTDGREQIAIIPKKPPLERVKNLKADHNYYVDATPKVHDVYLSILDTSENWKKWRTVLISGLRSGGPYYFAVDVTNPGDVDHPNGYDFGPEFPRIMWQWTDDKVGETWAKPDVGKIKVKEGANEVIKFVAFITGGYSTSPNVGNSFYIVDIETGTTLKSWVNLGAADNNIPSGPTAFDANGDGLIDYIYFGDTKGTLWRADVQSSNPNEWVLPGAPGNLGNPLFTPPSDKRKPIFYSPTVVKNKEGKILIFFGSGEELNLLTNTNNYFWEVWDDGGTGRIIIGSNWPKVLTGQKVLSSPVVANYVVYFTTWVYTLSSEYCGAGVGRLYGLKISSGTTEGGLPGLVTLDSHNPVSDDGYTTLGPGIPTSPIVTNGNIYVSSSVDAKNIIRIRFLGWPAATTRSWREVF